MFPSGSPPRSLGRAITRLGEPLAVQEIAWLRVSRAAVVVSFETPLFTEDRRMATRPEFGEPYERPRIERVLTPEDLEREVLYAGADGVSADLT
jgi:hypothetical protein